MAWRGLMDGGPVEAHMGVDSCGMWIANVGFRRGCAGLQQTRLSPRKLNNGREMRIPLLAHHSAQSK